MNADIKKNIASIQKGERFKALCRTPYCKECWSKAILLHIDKGVGFAPLSMCFDKQPCALNVNLKHRIL